MNERRLVVYHTSDVHARVGFGRKLASLIEPGALLVDCGDALRGSSTVYFSREPVVGEFALAPYAAQAVGNREFHYVHRFFLARSRMLPMPLVCSNLLDLRNRAPAFVRSLVVDAGGVRVRLLAALPAQYRTSSGWERIFGWRFLAPERALEELVPSASNGAAITILLSHLGLDEDRRMARAFPQLAAIVGGHTHTALSQPEMVGAMPISHAGAFARSVGRLELRVDPSQGTAEYRRFELLPLLDTGRSA